MKRRSAILSIFSLALFALLMVAMGKARAQEQVRTFTIAPPAVQVALDPGKTSEGKLKIINDGDTPLTFNTSIQDFTVKDDAGTPVILPPNTLSNKYSGASWIAIYPNQVVVAPHQKTEFSYFIQVPLDARPGGHYAAVVYTPTTTIGVNGTGASVNTSVGSLFYITVNGPVSEKATVNYFKTKGLWEYSPVNLSSQIGNFSDIHIRPVGTITLTSMLGHKTTASLAGYNIFPGVARNYETKVGKGFMLGYYKASLAVSYGSSNAVLNATTSFIVFPWKIVAFVLLLLVAFGAGYWYWKKDKETIHHEDHNSEASNPPGQDQTHR